MDAFAGSLIDERFELREVAGRGGMGTVYRALDRRTGRDVALKIMHADAGVARFEREARLLGLLDHPAFVRLVAHGRSEVGVRYLAMEWLDGVDLRRHLWERGLNVAETLVVARRVAAGLAEAHRQGVVHRDLKPSNLFLVDGDPARCRVLDLGVAHARMEAPLTRAGAVVGTPGYMSPEQARGLDGIDARADVFALGCVLYECLVGAPPFVGADPLAALAKIVLEGPPRVGAVRSELVGPLDDLVAEMMAKEPADRPADGAAVLERLERIESVRGPAPSRAAPAPTALSGDERVLVSVVLAVPPGASAAAVGADATLASTRLLEPAPELGVQLFRVVGGAYVASISGQGGARDRAARAADHALELRARLPRAAIVVATGPGVMEDQLASGEVLERACALANEPTSDPDGAVPDGSIVVDATTAGLLGDRYVVLRGATPIRLLGAAHTEEAERRLLGRRAPFVGRRREMAALLAAFEASEEEPSAVPVVVIAEPGMGKSRLRFELEASIGERARVLTARADPSRAGAPLGTVAAILRAASGAEAPEVALAAQLPPDRVDAVLPFLLEVLGVGDASNPQVRAARADASIMREQLRRAFEDWIVEQCRRAPLTLMLDDLHWSDPASVSLLDSALRTAAELPLFVVGCARPELRERFAGLWSARGAQEIALRPLSSREATALARGVLADATEAQIAQIVERAAGHPLYLEELIRAAAEGDASDRPRTVLAMIHGRLDALEPAERRVMRAASVFGDAMWVGGVAKLCGDQLPTDEILHALERLTSQELVRPSPTSRFEGEIEYAFRHDLVRVAASSMLSPSDLALGHRLAAEWLEGVGESDPLVLARHLDAGERPAEAAPRYRAAAEQALARGDVMSALAHAQASLERADATDDPATHLVAARAHTALGAPTEAAAAALVALEHAAPGSRTWWDAAGERVEVVGRLGDSEALRALSLAMRDATAEDAPLAAIVAWSRAAIALLFINEEGIADALIARIDAALPSVAGELLAPAWRSTLESYRAVRAGRLVEYLRTTTESAAALGRAGDLCGQCRQLVNVGTANQELGDYDAALVALERARAVAERLSIRPFLAIITFSAGTSELGRGRLDAAVEGITRGVEALEALGDPRFLAAARSLLALCHAQRGELAEALPLAEQALEASSEHPHIHVHARAVYAEVLRRAGRLDEAFAQAERAFAEREPLGHLESGDARVDRVWAEVLIATGREAEAAAVAASARARLLERAAAMDDERLRATFLENIEDHARLLRLGATPPAT
ncbi:MAG: protein kinase [Sandaracinaceae bacterium]|nr:protein kinase [Sandaracinaceae bacterium]